MVSNIDRSPRNRQGTEQGARRLPRFGFLVVWVSVLLGACHAAPRAAVIVDTGFVRAEVRARLGEPDRRREFKMPSTPFFGPQESLAGRVPAGTSVEEWVYREGDEERYVWFAGAEDQPGDRWRVIATGRYPAEAVY
jgi:hypothetical protein